MKKETCYLEFGLCMCESVTSTKFKFGILNIYHTVMPFETSPEDRSQSLGTETCKIYQYSPVDEHNFLLAYVKNL